MRILYTNFHPKGSGGHAPYIMNLARSFQGEHEITLATPGTSRLYALAGGIPGVRRVDAVYSTRLWPMLVEVCWLRRLLREGAFDVVHVNGSADHRQVMLARLGLRRAPRIVWTKHNTKSVRSPGNWIRARWGTDGAIGVCDFVSRQLQAPPYGRLPVRTIRLGVDTDHFAPPSPGAVAQAREELLGELSEDALVLGSVGGTDRDKGWIFLVRALARLPQAARMRVRLLIAGDPPPESLRQEVRERGMEDIVVFPGQLEDPRRVLAASHVGFVLSLHEAGSYAACESLAMGLPTLVSDAGGLPELVRHGEDGWVVPKGDVDALRGWLLERLDAPPIRPGVVQSARDRALALFSMPVFARRTMDFYREVCA
ncbi:glycosyltransferase [Castellaniella sp. S9]|uniref:glycosyltransferase n=1 Tax=Castellaniella sp. S9 TaxID=2993652 RepID=UPI0022B3DF2E|nr:glycosyltransferase [Castellaniella sp. S9]